MHEIYNMKLHEVKCEADYQITRVAGGWIYRFWDYEKKDYYHDSVFVPFNNEFKGIPEITEFPTNGNPIY